MLPQSPLPPSLGKGVRSVKLPNMPVGALCYAATIHNGKVYIRAYHRDGNNQPVFPVLVYSTNEHKWSTLPKQQGSATIARVSNHVTLIGGKDVSTGKVTNTLSTWYEEEGRWKQVLPSMATRRVSPAVISHDNLLLVTGGVADDDTVLNTTDVLDLATMKWTTPEGLDLPVPLWRHHLALAGEYLYLVGGSMEYPRQSTDEDNSQAWRAKWSDVKQTAAPQHSQPQRGVWTRIADPTLFPTPVSCGGTLYTVGGRTRDDKPISTVNAYIAARNQWVSVGDMSMRRVGHGAVPLSNTTIFVAGGRVTNDRKYTYSLLTELLLL